MPLRNDGNYAQHTSLASHSVSFNTPAQSAQHFKGDTSDHPTEDPSQTLQLHSSSHSDVLQVPLNENQSVPQFIVDDRLEIKPDSKSVLIVEDDRDFASVLSGIAHQKDYLCIAAGDGKSALQIAQQYQPSAILLDLGLPDIDGLKLLDILKQDLNTRHIPVHVITGREVLGETLTRGAVGFLHKPTSAEELNNVFSVFDRYLSNKDKTILIIEDDDTYRSSLKAMLEHKDVNIVKP